MLPDGPDPVTELSGPGNCAVWHSGRGSLGAQLVGTVPLRLGMPRLGLPEGELGLVVVPWFCRVELDPGLDGSLGDTFWAMTGEASKAATAAAVRRRNMRVSFSWRGRLGGLKPWEQVTWHWVHHPSRTNHIIHPLVPLRLGP